MNERRNTIVNEQLFYLQNFINECDQLKITPVEYAYLKLISLFDSGKKIFRNRLGGVAIACFYTTIHFFFIKINL